MTVPWLSPWTAVKVIFKAHGAAQLGTVCALSLVFELGYSGLWTTNSVLVLVKVFSLSLASTLISTEFVHRLCIRNKLCSCCPPNYVTSTQHSTDRTQFGMHELARHKTVGAWSIHRQSLVLYV
jgi:hypothetical protein